MSFNNGPTIVTNGLVLALDAGDRNSYVSGSTTWFDLTGVNNGTLTNGPTFNTGSGGSIVFDGMNDYVIIPTSFGSEGSICCWVYPKDTNDNFFVYSTNNTTSEYSHKLGITTNNKLNAYLWPANPTSFDGTDFMATNRWHYCVFWWKNGVGYGSYLNSTSQGTGSISSAWSSGYNLFVGSNSGGPAAGYLNGNVSVIQTYQRALTESEVLQNYNAQKSRFGL